MTSYKGYTIEKITRNDWMTRNSKGELVFTENGRPTTKTLKEAKAMIDRICR